MTINPMFPRPKRFIIIMYYTLVTDMKAEKIIIILIIEKHRRDGRRVTHYGSIVQLRQRRVGVRCGRTKMQRRRFRRRRFRVAGDGGKKIKN